MLPLGCICALQILPENISIYGRQGYTVADNLPQVLPCTRTGVSIAMSNPLLDCTLAFNFKRRGWKRSPPSQHKTSAREKDLLRGIISRAVSPVTRLGYTKHVHRSYRMDYGPRHQTKELRSFKYTCTQHHLGHLYYTTACACNASHSASGHRLCTRKAGGQYICEVLATPEKRRRKTTSVSPMKRWYRIFSNRAHALVPLPGLPDGTRSSARATQQRQRSSRSLVTKRNKVQGVV